MRTSQVFLVSEVEQLQEEVKFIFKTLIKVPVVIFFSYFIFNIIFFFYIYFQMLGFSYVIMQTAVENNYLPTSELNTLAAYLEEMELRNGQLQNCHVIIGLNSGDHSDYAMVSNGYRAGGSRVPVSMNKVRSITDNHAVGSSEQTGVDNSALTRRQYGANVVVGCYCEYKIIWPLRPDEQVSGYSASTGATEDAVDGMSGTAGTRSNESELEKRRKDSRHEVKLPMHFVYQVPGLKYYPDMSM